MTFPPQLARRFCLSAPCSVCTRYFALDLDILIPSSAFLVVHLLLSLPVSADNGEEFLPNRFVKSCAWAGSYKSLAHYCTRGWCRLEMLLGQTEPLPQDGFMFNFLVPKKKKVSLKVSVCLSQSCVVCSWGP